MAIVDAVFVFIQEYECPGRGRAIDLDGLFVHRVAFLIKEDQPHVDPVHVAVHGIAADPQKLLAPNSRPSQIRRAPIDGGGFVVGEERALLNQSFVGRVREIILHIAQNPGLRAGSNIRIVRYNFIVIVIRVHVPAKLKLLQIVQTGRLQSLRFRLAQSG